MLMFTPGHPYVSVALESLEPNILFLLAEVIWNNIFDIMIQLMERAAIHTTVSI